MEPLDIAEPRGVPPAGPLRCLIRCRTSRFEQRGKSDVQLVEKLAKRLHLDADKLVHIGTKKNPHRVHIIVDYDNPNHQPCAVRAFKGNSLKDIRLPESAIEYLHWHVGIWNDMIARWGGRFPFQQGDHVELRRKKDCGSSEGALDGRDDSTVEDCDGGKVSLDKPDDGAVKTTEPCQRQEQGAPE
ncbi:hypothetical protein C8A01DRAFT_17238 [Parachaetomium inaequale]|uniref:Uncharacterized protein n=1 Tax=Parachaetomium inaequale TaxID=2588326 RepID=A0AAN6PER6_9PEZI|nr:hypothetical protein C8A01DRAFT_17238 [Parachaetomium inaequale]